MGVDVMAMWTPGAVELIVIAGVGLLIFGRRLPDVARSVGKSIVEFKKGMRDVKEDIDVQSRINPPAQPKLDHQPEPPALSSPSVRTATPAPASDVPAPAGEESGTPN